MYYVHVVTNHAMMYDEYDVHYTLNYEEFLWYKNKETLSRYESEVNLTGPY